MLFQVHENLIQDQLQRKQEQLQKTIVKQQEELRKISEQLLMAQCGILPSFMDDVINFNLKICIQKLKLNNFVKDSLQMSTPTSRQTTQPETSTNNQIICSTDSGELFESSSMISSDVLLLHERVNTFIHNNYLFYLLVLLFFLLKNEQDMQHSYSSNIIQNMVDEGGGQLDYSFNSQSNDVLFDQSSP